MNEKQLKSFKSLEDFLNSKEFASEELCDLDLSNLDLSKISMYTWLPFHFNNVDFSNTNINIKIPYLYSVRLDKGSMINCNFTNCDLSSWMDGDLDNIDIRGCNFTNTKLHISINPFKKNAYFLDSIDECYRDFTGLKLSEEYSLEELKKFYHCFDGQAIKFYPNLNLNYQELIDISHKYLDIHYTYAYELFSIKEENERLYFNDDKFIEKYCKLKEIPYEDFINGIKCVQDVDLNLGGKMRDLYEELSKKCLTKMTENDKILFYLGYVIDKNFSDIDFTQYDEKILNSISFFKCNFKTAKFKSFFSPKESFYGMSGSKFDNIIFNDIKLSSWQKKETNRFLNSHVIFKTNAYVELDRVCNAKCEFCRNQYLDKCDYNLDQIIKTILNYPKINSIIVGGGEPTMKCEDLKTLINEISRSVIEIAMFTNGSDLDKLLEIRKSRYVELFISRHAVDDSLNNKIFNHNVLTNKEILKLTNQINSYINLVCTCFKGDGVDSLEKMKDYIKKAQTINCRSIIFQTLHQDLKANNLVDGIDQNLFDKVIQYLKENNWIIDEPIYSTGNYKLIIAKNKENKVLQKISFKKYITEEELKNNWYKAAKRTFDLSIDPAGNLYENYHQSYGLVKKIK